MTESADGIYIGFGNGRNRTAGWTVSLPQEGMEGQVNVLGPRKLSAAEVQSVADLLSRILKTSVPTQAIRLQNLHGHAMAEQAAKAAEESYKILRDRAGLLAEWQNIDGDEFNQRAKSDWKGGN